MTALGGVGVVTERPDSHLRLRRATRDFEAILINSLLEKAQASAGSVDEDPKGEGQTMMSYATQAVARAIAERGGFGIADMLFRRLIGSSPNNAKPLQQSADYHSVEGDTSRYE
jgi:Rod binding domain-containing protein